MNDLKARLTAIVENDYQQTEDAFPLAEAMLARVGDTDPELRDTLIYGVFIRWIIRDVFSTSELLAISAILRDEDHLTLGLGESGSDSVFTRSFSMLLLTGLVYRHRSQPLYARKDLLGLFQQVMDVFEQEQDLRGFVPVKGWAHTAAHTADVLDEFALCPELGREELKRLLAAIRTKIAVSQHLYACDEDERMTTAAVGAIRREEVSQDDVRKWLEGFPALLDEELEQPLRMWQRANMRHFLRSLAYRFKAIQENAYDQALNGALAAVSPYQSPPSEEGSS